MYWTHKHVLGLYRLALRGEGRQRRADAVAARGAAAGSGQGDPGQQLRHHRPVRHRAEYRRLPGRGDLLRGDESGRAGARRRARRRDGRRAAGARTPETAAERARHDFYAAAVDPEATRPADGLHRSWPRRTASTTPGSRSRRGAASSPANRAPTAARRRSPSPARRDALRRLTLPTQPTQKRGLISA